MYAIWARFGSGSGGCTGFVRSTGSRGSSFLVLSVFSSVEFLSGLVVGSFRPLWEWGGVLMVIKKGLKKGVIAGLKKHGFSFIFQWITWLIHSRSMFFATAINVRCSGFVCLLFRTPVSLLVFYYGSEPHLLFSVTGIGRRTCLLLRWLPIKNPICG